MSKQDQPNKPEYAVGGWIRQMEDDGGYHYYSGRKRTSGLAQDHDAAGGFDSLITFHQPDGVAVANKPGLCPACGAMVNPLTTGCRC